MPRIIRRNLPELIPSESGTVGLLNVPKDSVNDKVYLKYLMDKEKRKLKNMRSLGLLGLPEGSFPKGSFSRASKKLTMGSYRNKANVLKDLDSAGDY